MKRNDTVPGTRFDPVLFTTWGALLGPREMAAIWRVGKSQYHRLVAQGAFDQFKVKPAIGPKCYSALLVQRYLAGEPIFATLVRRKTS